MIDIDTDIDELKVVGRIPIRTVPPRRKKERTSGWVRSKHTLGKQASIKSLKRYCKEIWAEYVKERDAHKCVICGNENYLNAHHIITSKCLHTRFEPDCGISVCAKHHMLGTVSAHGTPWIIYEWLEKNRPEQYKWFIKNRENVYQPPVNATIDFYKDTLKKLLDRFDKDYPAVLKRSKYYTFNAEEEKRIIQFYQSNETESLTSLAANFNCGETVIKGVLRRNKVPIRKNPSKHIISDENIVLVSSLQKQTNEEKKALLKIYRSSLEYKQKRNEYYSRPEVKERLKAYKETPEFKAKANAYSKAHYRQNIEKLKMLKEINDGK